MHGNAFHPVALTSFAAPASNVEGKPSFVIAAQLGFRSLGKQIPDIIKDAGVGHRIGARRTADRILRDLDDFIKIFQAENGLVLARLDAGTA